MRGPRHERLAVAVKIVVTGAAGFIGSALCGQLARAGHEVRPLVRSPARGLALPQGACPAPAVEDSAGWLRTLSGADAVVHLAARAHRGEHVSRMALEEFEQSNVRLTATLRAAGAVAGVNRWVFLSSVKVFGEGAPASAADPIARFGPESPTAPAGPYGLTKLAAEGEFRALHEAMGGTVTILRAPLVYGPGMRGNLATLMKLVARGVPLPLASVRNRRSLIHRDTLVSFILCALACGDGRLTTLVPSDLEVSTPELVALMAGGLGRRPRLFAFPPALLRALGALSGQGPAIARLTGSFLVDGAAATRRLGSPPPLDQTAAWREIATAFRGRSSE